MQKKLLKVYLIKEAVTGQERALAVDSEKLRPAVEETAEAGGSSTSSFVQEKTQERRRRLRGNCCPDPPGTVPNTRSILPPNLEGVRENAGPGNARPGSGQLGSDPYRATTLESAPVISPEEKAKLEQEIATREATIDRLQKELDKVKAKMPDLPPLLKRSGRFYVDELTHQGKFNSLPREDKTFFIGEVNWQKEEHSRPLEEKKKAKEREFKKHQREEEFEIQNLKKQLEGKGPVDESVRELHDLSVAQDDARDEKSEVDARWMPPINEFAKEADFAKWCCEEAGLLKLSGEPCESKGGRAGDGLNKNWLAASDDEKEQMRRDYNEKFLPKQEAERTKQKAKAAQKVADADRNLLRATGN